MVSFNTKFKLFQYDSSCALNNSVMPSLQEHSGEIISARFQKAKQPFGERSKEF